VKHAPRLRLVPGGRHAAVRIAGIDVVPGPPGDPPFAADTRVVEEDTWRLLSPGPSLQRSSEHPVRLMTDLVHDEPAVPGQVLVGRHRWRAVVYDLDREPICRPDWIAAALEAVLRLVRTRGRRSLALPLLGCSHGPIGWRQALDLVVAALEGSARPPFPARVWLQVEPQRRAEVLKALRDHRGGLPR
jgi:hypothetical protein